MGEAGPEQKPHRITRLHAIWGPHNTQGQWGVGGAQRSTMERQGEDGTELGAGSRTQREKKTDEAQRPVRTQTEGHSRGTKGHNQETDPRLQDCRLFPEALGRP